MKFWKTQLLRNVTEEKIIPKESYKIYMYRGYAGISLKHEKVSVHRIIGKYMVGFDFGKDIHVHHIDKNKLNNRISNLQVLKSSLHLKGHEIYNYVSKDKLRENALIATERIKRNDVDKEKVFELRKQGMTIPQIAEILNCGISTVKRRLGINT